jgi:hypothetical protein
VSILDALEANSIEKAAGQEIAVRGAAFDPTMREVRVYAKGVLLSPDWSRPQ